MTAVMPYAEQAQVLPVVDAGRLVGAIFVADVVARF
jgi:CBS domain-containing protein